MKGDRTKHFEVREMEEAVRTVLSQMEERHRISEGHYRLIIGDDASGRLFGMIFAKVIGSIHSMCNIPPPSLAFCVGHPKVSQQFINHMTDVVDKRLKALLQTGKYSELGRRLPRALEQNVPHPQVLVATDAIHSGSSLAPVVRACANNGVGIEAAAIQIRHTGEYDVRKYLGNTTLYDGETERSIYQQYSLIGVYKERGNDEIAKVYQLDGSNHAASARSDVAVITDRLVDWFAKKFKIKNSL